MPVTSSGGVWGSIAGTVSNQTDLQGELDAKLAIAATNVSAAGFVINEDNMASDLDTKVPTQQSVKAYVDTSVAGVSGGTVQGTDGTYDIQATNEGAGAGNARGEYSIDLQLSRDAVTDVASGVGSVLVGGRGNSAPGVHAVVIGGEGAKAFHHSEVSFSSRGLNVAGDNQISFIHLAGSTADATPTELQIGVSGGNYFTIASGDAYRFKASVFGIKSSDGTEYVDLEIVGKIANIGGTTAVVGTNVTMVYDRSTATLTATATADDGNDRLAITVTGKAANTMYWNVKLELQKIGL